MTGAISKVNISADEMEPKKEYLGTSREENAEL
jgi:hypothetical protein